MRTCFGNGRSTITEGCRKAGSEEQLLREVRQAYGARLSLGMTSKCTDIGGSSVTLPYTASALLIMIVNVDAEILKKRASR